MSTQHGAVASSQATADIAGNNLYARDEEEKLFQ